MYKEINRDEGEKMFGYVMINKPEMKFKEYDIYHSYYCGLCVTLKDNYGYRAQISLNNDLTFVAMLLSSLYEPKTTERLSACVMHPLHKYLKRFNECIDYAAKMTIVLTYFKCQDDWLDEKKYSRQAYQKLLHKSFLEIRQEYPDKVKKIADYLKQIHVYEKENSGNLDEISKYSGYMMAEICTYKNDEWHDDLYEFGFYLGKFIYFMDAYDDIEDDIKKGCYNPLTSFYQKADFEEKSYAILEMMISKATTAFECLPIVENIEIMRNILYSGVWSRYELVKKKRMGERS